MQAEINIGTSNAVKSIENLKNAFTDLFQTSSSTKDMFSDVKPIGIDNKNITMKPLDKSLEAQDEFASKLSNVNQLFSFLQQDIAQTSESLKRFIENQKNNEQKLLEPTAKPLSERTEEKKDGNISSTDAKNIINATQNASNIARTAISGDPWGATISAGTQVSKGLIDKGTKDDGSLGWLGKLGVGGTIAGVVLGAGNAASKQYENALSEIDNLLTNFGVNTNLRNGNVNASEGINLRGIASQKSIGTGFDIPTFAEYMGSFSRYGITDANKAGDLARAAAGWSRYAGVDMGAATGFMGTVERLGGNSREAMLNAYNASVASGLDRTQFSEFLAGVQRAMEDGISKGFIRSTDDIANNLANLAELSGGSRLWQGEQGARRYTQMAQGLAGMTGLNSTASLVTYRTVSNLLGNDDINAEKHLGKGNYVKGGSVYNELALMEKGDISPEFIETLRKNVDAVYGNDTDSKIAQYKEMFGLSNQGAVNLYNLIHDSTGMTSSQIAKKASELKEDPTMLSDATKLQDSMNRLSDSIVKSTQPLFKIKFDSLENIDSGVSKIADMVAAAQYKDSVDSVIDRFFSDYEAGEQKNAKNKITEMLNSHDPKVKAEGIALIERLTGLSDDQATFINENNLLSDTDGLLLPPVIKSSSKNKIVLPSDFQYLIDIGDERLNNALIQATNSNAPQYMFDGVVSYYNKVKTESQGDILTEENISHIVGSLEAIARNTASMEL